MRLETAVLGLVVEVKVEVLDTEARVLDGLETVVGRHLALCQHSLRGFDIFLALLLVRCVAVLGIIV